MPELPEVETVIRTLRPMLEGRTLHSVLSVRRDMVRPRGTDLSRELPGRLVDRIDRRGKRILIRLDDGRTLYIHLGMTGRLTMEACDTPTQRHTHLVIRVSNRHLCHGGLAPPCKGCGPEVRTAGQARRGTSDMELRFVDPRRFGEIALLEKGDPGDAGLGPDALLLRAAVLARLLADRKRPIKSTLLDQALIAGLGNIYADEALFAARIHPLTRASDLTADHIRRLCRAIKLVLRRALRMGGSSLRDYVDANGRSGFAQQAHRVYDRERLPCRTCRTKIERLVLTGRSTCFCPKCQRAITPC